MGEGDVTARSSQVLFLAVEGRESVLLLGKWWSEHTGSLG